MLKITLLFGLSVEFDVVKRPIISVINFIARKNAEKNIVITLYIQYNIFYCSHGGNANA